MNFDNSAPKWPKSFLQRPAERYWPSDYLSDPVETVEGFCPEKGYPEVTAFYGKMITTRTLWYRETAM